MEKSIKENREEFYLKYYDLFEDGTLREIYTGEKINYWNSLKSITKDLIQIKSLTHVRFPIYNAILFPVYV